MENKYTIDSEREWRKFLMREVEEIRKDQKSLLNSMENLKVKVALISTGIAAVVGFLINKI